MTTMQSRPEMVDETDDVVGRLVKLLPEEDRLDLDSGDEFADAVLALGDLAADGVTIPSDLADALSKLTDSRTDLDGLFRERLAKVAP